MRDSTFANWKARSELSFPALCLKLHIGLGRAEIGPSCYVQAKKQLPELEWAIADTYRPFVARVASQEAWAKAPLPAPVKAWLTDIMTICNTVPNTV